MVSLRGVRISETFCEVEFKLRQNLAVIIIRTRPRILNLEVVLDFDKGIVLLFLTTRTCAMRII